MSRWDTARRAVEIFFPQRVVLRIDGHGYSATILHRILHMAAVSSSFDQAAVALQVVGELAISDRQINNLAAELGGQLAAERDEQTQRWLDQPLPRQRTSPETPLELAAVFTDGGRMRTRHRGQGPGVHDPHWRETKNAAFHRMSSGSFSQDPQPDLPACFRNQAYVEKLVRGLKNQQTEGREETPLAPEDGAAALPLPEPSAAWRPETLYRSCLSSLATSEEFGPMMASAADARGFFQAAKRAFVGDGQSYNWTIWQRWFRDFVPIADFVHVVEYLYDAARALHEDRVARWQQYVAWAQACWQSQVDQVIDDLRNWQARGEALPENEPLPPTDPRKILSSTVTYLSNNRSRMDYARYRREGLPVTSSLGESLVKQINKRVKGTEMFWNDGPSGEAMLQLRAAILSDGAPLQRWLTTRNVSPFSPRTRSQPLAASA